MELRHLRYFVTVAETLHFGHAAERLHIAQPPLSQQIRRLELELGVRLLRRTSRRVELTDAGRAFVVEARRTLRHAARAAEVAIDADRVESGRLEIGYMASAELGVFPKLLPAFRRRYPRVEIALHMLSPREQFHRLRAGRLAMGFVRLPVRRHPALTVVPVWREPLIAVLPEAHVLARRRTVALRELGGEPFVVFPRDHAPGYYDFLMRLYRDAAVNPRRVHESEKLQTIVSLVAMGRGVSLMPRCVTNLARKGVAYRALRPRVPDTELGLVYDPRRGSPVVSAFVSLVEELFVKPMR